MYGIGMALTKWASWIGAQRITLLTDHQSLQGWTKENVETPNGPSGRRGRIHQLLSRYNLDVMYVKGADHVGADALSRWSYTAATSEEVSIHGLTEMAAESKRLEAQADGTEEYLHGGDEIAKFLSPVNERFPAHHEICGCKHCAYRKNHKKVKPGNVLPPEPCKCPNCANTILVSGAIEAQTCCCPDSWCDSCQYQKANCG